MLNTKLQFSNISLEASFIEPLQDFINMLFMFYITDLIKQVLQLLRTELEELVDVARATMEPIKPCDEEW